MSLFSRLLDHGLSKMMHVIRKLTGLDGQFEKNNDILLRN